MKDLRITKELKDYLKKPWGELIKEEYKLKELIGKEKPAKVVSVGDVVSRRLIEINLRPDIAIVDRKTLRETLDKEEYQGLELRLVNQAGRISAKAWEVISSAYEKKEFVKIIVEGEEDLLAIPAVLLAPFNSLILYGQPSEGVVCVRVDKEIKKRCRWIVERMEEVG